MAWEAFRALCARWAARWGLPPLILWVIATIESSRRPGASNTEDPRAAAKGGAWGLFAMTLDTAKALIDGVPVLRKLAGARWDGTGPALLDPELNTMLASYYLGRLWKEFGAFLPTVAAYHQGASTVRKLLAAHGDELAANLPPKGKAYVAKALAVKQELADRGTA